MDMHVYIKKVISPNGETIPVDKPTAKDPEQRYSETVPKGGYIIYFSDNSTDQTKLQYLQCHKYCTPAKGTNRGDDGPYKLHS